MKLKSTFLILALLAGAVRNYGQAQSITWSAAQSVAAGSLENHHPRVVLTANGSPLVLWGKSSANSVYLSRWTGAAFSAPVKMNPAGVSVFAETWAGPDIAANGDTVYVVYKVQPEDTGGIYLLKSTNAGASFGMPVRVDNISFNSSRFPTVSTDAAGQPIVGFMKFNSGFTSARWVVARSMNWGASFMADVPASSYNGEPVCDCCPGSVVSSGNTMAMLYRNNWNNKRTMWAGVSNNGGATFPAGMEVDNTAWNINACPSSGPDGVIIGDTLYAAFMSGNKVYYSKSKLSTMQGGSAVAVTGASAGITGQNFPRVAGDGNTVAIVWPQIENNLPQVAMLFAKNIQNGFPAWEKVIINTAGNYIMNADVAVKNGSIHVVWEDMATGTVMYRKGTYNTTGINELKSRNEISLAPVPADNELRLTLRQPETKPCTITVTDVAGRTVFQHEYLAIGAALTIPMAALPAGIYLLKMITVDGVSAKKLVVSH